MIIKAVTLRLLAKAQYLDTVQFSGHFTKNSCLIPPASCCRFNSVTFLLYGSLLISYCTESTIAV
jgi:hypothetical protein